MKCTANEDCDHEKRILDNCIAIKIRPPRKEIYTTLTVCAVAIFMCIGYLWLAVGAKASDAEVNAWKKETTDILHRQEIIMTRMEGVVGTSAETINKECMRSKIEDRDIKESMNKKLDAMEKRVGQLEYRVNTP